MSLHVSDYALGGAVESVIRKAEDAGMIADADLDTSISTVIGKVESKDCHVADEGMKLPIGRAILVGNILYGATPFTNTDTDDVKVAVEGNWTPGLNGL